MKHQSEIDRLRALDAPPRSPLGYVLPVICVLVAVGAAIALVSGHTIQGVG